MATALLALVTGAVLLIWVRFSESASAAIYGGAAVVVAVVAVAVPWAFNSPGPGTDSASGQVMALAAKLADVVRRQWELEADIRQLRDPQPLTVHWLPSKPLLMDWPKVIGATRLSLTGHVGQVVEKYDALPRRRLAVIGEPGAGKTGVLLLLTLGLLKRRGATGPVPVLLTPSSWDPRGEPFLDWLARHLADEYPFLRRVGAKALIEQGSILPILDGLDEMDNDALGVAVQVMNGPGMVERPFIIACRSLEFAQAVGHSDVLTGAAVVELEPIPPQQAREYLRLSTPRDDRLDRWAPVFTELRRGSSSPVAAALSTPLMVTLARTVYSLDRRADPGELVDATRFPTPQAIEDHLLDSLVPATFRAGSGRRKRAPRWDSGQAQHWLRFLATQLHQRGIRDLAWWQLARSRRSHMSAHRPARAVGLAAGLAVCLVVGPVAGLGILAGNPGKPDLLFGVEAGVVFGMAYGIAVGFTTRLVYAILARLLEPGVAGYVAGFLAGLAAGLATGWLFGFAGGLSLGLVAALPAAVAGGTVLSPFRPARVVLLADRTLLNRLRGAVGFGIAAAIVAGLATSLGFGLVYGLVGGLVLGLGVVVGFGLAFGVMRESHRLPSPRFSLRADRTATALSVLTASVVLSSSLLLEVAFLYKPTRGTTVGWESFLLPAEIVLSLAGGLLMAANRPWPWYQLARAGLALREQIPWRLLTFLEEGHRLGILRQVGAVYQFRHARLQDRLAGTRRRPSKAFGVARDGAD